MCIMVVSRIGTKRFLKFQFLPPRGVLQCFFGTPKFQNFHNIGPIYMKFGIKVYLQGIRKCAKKIFEIPIFTPPGGTSVFFWRTKISKFSQFLSNLHEIWHKSVSLGYQDVCQKDFRNSNFYPPGGDFSVFSGHQNFKISTISVQFT